MIPGSTWLVGNSYANVFQAIAGTRGRRTSRRNRMTQGAMMTTPEITALAQQYFADLERDNRTDNDENLRAWLWFTCPAHMRIGVGTAIEQERKRRAAGDMERGSGI